MSNSVMTNIQGSSLDLGMLPFNLHVRDASGRMVLFGRKGLQITKEVKDSIVSSNRSFYIEHGDLSSYIDYKLKRVKKSLEDPNMPTAHKQKMVKEVGSRIIQKIEQGGMDEATATHSKEMMSSVVSMITGAPETYSGLLSISTLSSYLYDHAINTSTFAIMLGQIIYGNSEKKLYLIGLGSLLMDIGMSKLNSGIINKKGELEKKEVDHIRKHTQIGYELLKSEHLPSFVADMALHHHERMDGSGYPDGLAGSNIRPYLRICGVADVYDALTSNRAFRKPMKSIDAIEFMLSRKQQFSMDVLNALMKLVLKDERLINLTLQRYS